MNDERIKEVVNRRDLVFLDTNIFVFLSNEPRLFNNYIKNIASKGLFTAVGHQLVELYKGFPVPDRLTEIVGYLLPVEIKSLEEVLNDEIEAYPKYNTRKLGKSFLTVFSEDDKQEFKKQLTGKALTHTWKIIKDHSLLAKNRIIALKKNFPPLKNGKYDAKQAKEFASLLIKQWLGSDYPDFIKSTIKDFNHTTFLSIRLYALYSFYKFYLLPDRNYKRTDFPDFFHCYALPYCKVAIVEKDMCHILRRIQREQDILQNVQIENIEIRRKDCGVPKTKNR